MRSSRFSASVALVTLASFAFSPALGWAQAPAAKPAAPAGAKPAAPAGAKPAAPAAKPAAPAGAKPAAAGAKPAAKGKTALQRAKDAQKAGDHATALEEYKAALAEKDTPEAQLGLAQTQDALKDYPAAVASYEKFLAAVPKAMVKDGETAKARSAEIQQMPATLKITSVPEGAVVTVDEKLQEAKTPSSVEVPAGKHKVTVSQKGYDPSTQEVEATFAATVEVKAELKETPAAPPPPPAAPVPVAKTEAPPPPVKPRSKVPAFITGGIAVAALGVGTGFGIRALAKKGDFNDAPTEDTANSGENSALIADMAFGVALTFGITSAVLFLAKDEPRATATAPQTPAARSKQASTWKLTPAPYFNQHGGGAGALVRF